MTLQRLAQHLAGQDEHWQGRTVYGQHPTHGAVEYRMGPDGDVQVIRDGQILHHFSYETDVNHPVLRQHRVPVAAFIEMPYHDQQGLRTPKA